MLCAVIVWGLLKTLCLRRLQCRFLFEHLAFQELCMIESDRTYALHTELQEQADAEEPQDAVLASLKSMDRRRTCAESKGPT